MLNLIKNLKKNKDDKESLEEFYKIYLENFRKDSSDQQKKLIFFSSKYFTRKNFRIAVLEQNGTTNTIQYDSHSNSSKEISSPPNHGGNIFNININKTLFDTVFGEPSMKTNDTPYKTKIHFFKQDSHILFSLIYPSYSQILKRIRSLSHSPSLSRSSSLGDYASLNNMSLNDLGSQIQKRVAICVAWSVNLDDENLKYFFRFIYHFFFFLSCLAEKIAQIYQEVQAFCSERMTKSRHWFVDSLRTFFTSHRLPLPVWQTFSILERNTLMKEAANCGLMKQVFMERIIGHLLMKFHTKEKGFFLARLLTAILIYHQGWIHGVSPMVHNRHLRLFSCQPGVCRLSKPSQNIICAQLGACILGCGGLTVSRTIVTGSNQTIITMLLYFVTYWLRCCTISIKLERSPDADQLTDPRKAPNRRKSASCNDPTDSGIASQEDIRRLLFANNGARGSNNTIHMIGGGNRTNGSSYGPYKSSASTGSSPVKDFGDLQSKNFFTRDQIMSVDIAAVDYVMSQKLQRRPSDALKSAADKGSNSSMSLDVKIQVNDTPLLHGGITKMYEDMLYRSIAHFNIGHCLETVVPNIVLQGTTDITVPNQAMEEDLRCWLKHIFWLYPSRRKTEIDWSETFSESITSRPYSATAIILNTDKTSVNLWTVYADGNTLKRDLHAPSPIIMALLDQLQVMIANRVDAPYVYQFIDSSLASIYRQSGRIVSYVRMCKNNADLNCETFTVDRTHMSQALPCHIDDLPLLYSTALAHSPEVCGLEADLLC